MFNKQLLQYQLFIKNQTMKSALQNTFLPFKIKIKGVLKIMSQPPGLVPPKQLFTQKMIKEAKYLRKTHKGAHFHQTADIQPAALLEMRPPQEFPKYT